MTLLSLMITGIVLVVCISGVYVDTVSLIVNTTHGPVRGEAVTLKTNKSLVQFLGVPFAQAERFEAPREPNPWKVVLNATSFGKACPQNHNPVVNSTEDIDEDCLSVNVFVPKTEAPGNLAVMVWVYGGGFQIGGSGFYNGAFIATEGEVVVVTFNYRLGVLGFLSTGTQDIPGNFGLLDQVRALHWVQKNIARFGGDPKQVTLFGQSTGAASIFLHMFSPLSYGLYHQVILESGTALPLLAFANNASAIETSQTLANVLSCEIPGLKECLKKRNVSEILAAQSKFPPYSFRPVVDHDFVKDQPSNLLNKGDFNQTVPTMIGVTKDEGGFFLLPFKGMHPGIPDIDKGLNKTLFNQLIKKGKWIDHQNNQVENAVIFEYTDWSNQTNPLVVRQKYMDVITDCYFKAPAVHTAMAFVGHNMKTYFYRFDHFVSRTYPSWAGVVHCADLVYVFGHPFSHYNKSTARQDTEIAFSKDIISMWGSFAKTGDPTPDGKPFKWPEFSYQKQEYASLSPNFTIQSNLLPEKMAFWNSYVQSLSQSNSNTTQMPIGPTAVPTKPTGQTKANSDKGTEHALIGVVVILGVLLLVLLVVVWRLKGKLENARCDPGPSTRLI